MELMFVIVSYTVPCFGCVTKAAFLTHWAQQCFHGAKAFSAPHSNIQWGIGRGHGAGGGTAGTADLRECLCLYRILLSNKTGDGGCSRGLLLGDCLGIYQLVVIAFSLLVFRGFVSIFSLLSMKVFLTQPTNFLTVALLWDRVWRHFSIC